MTENTARDEEPRKASRRPGWRARAASTWKAITVMPA